MLFDNLVLFRHHTLVFQQFEFVLCSKICRGFFLLSSYKMESVCLYMRILFMIIPDLLFWGNKMKASFHSERDYLKCPFFFPLSWTFASSFQTWETFHRLSRSTLHFVGALMRFFCTILIIMPAEVGLEDLCSVDAAYHIAGFLPTYYYKL